MYNQVGQTSLVASDSMLTDSAMQTVRAPAEGEAIGPVVEAPSDEKDPCEDCPTTIVKWRTKYVNVPGPVRTVTKKEIVYRDRPCPSPPDSGGGSVPVAPLPQPTPMPVVPGVPDSGFEDESAEKTGIRMQGKFPWWLVLAAAGAGVYLVTRK